jgi:phenylpropionate dioxygenase-like ring-hydroxylating dioxygenase large terminal subunit
MLSKADTETLSRIGPGTLMGDLMRQYWHPVLYGWEIERDGAPLRVRVLGEDLVAFRDSDGRPSFVAENCPHRGASLFFGRNEEQGLRCVYHGWKFDTSGACVDMPNEPPESNFKHKVRVTAYRAEDHGDVVWIYMGTRQANPPGLPQLEWATVPAEQRKHLFKGIYHANWAQVFEGEVDTSHVYFLHSRVRPEDPPQYGLYHPDRSPKLDILETDLGLMYGARRMEPDGTIYWRTTQILFPGMALFPGQADGTGNIHMYTPVDDTHTLHWGVHWHPTRVMPGDRALHQEVSNVPDHQGLGPMRTDMTGQPFSNWWPVAGPDNDFMVDRETQKTASFTGVPTIRIQDGAMFWSMGPIMNRTKEHLGTADAAVIRARRRFIKMARDLREQGTVPAGVDAPELWKQRSCQTWLDAETNWKETLADWHAARSDVLPSVRGAAPPSVY